MGGERFDVGYASGVFDLFHVGHLRLLRRARAQSRRLIVGVASDEYATALKGRPPVVSWADRVEIVAAVDAVDEVVMDRDLDKGRVWRHHPFQVIFKGDDWKGTAHGDRLEHEMRRVGARVVYLPYTGHTSTTRLRAGLMSSGLMSAGRAR